MTDLQTFLSDMALNPQKFADFLRDPDEAIGRAGLSEEDRAALISGIPAMIWARLVQYLAYPPPYYTPAVSLNAAFPRPNFVTVPLAYDWQGEESERKPPINYVTIAPLYVTAAPPLFITTPKRPPRRKKGRRKRKP